MKNLREESVCLVQHGLAAVLGEADGAFRDRAEALVAIAEQFSVSVSDALLPWLHVCYAGKDWSVPEWRHWCERYTEAMEEARREILQHMLFQRGEEAR